MNIYNQSEKLGMFEDKFKYRGKKFFLCLDGIFDGIIVFMNDDLVFYSESGIPLNLNYVPQLIPISQKKAKTLYDLNRDFRKLIILVSIENISQKNKGDE